MTYPGHWAATQPDAAAIIMAGSGETVTRRTFLALAQMAAQH